MILRIIPGGAFVENTYILQAKNNDEVILIDPGSQTDEIEASLSELSFNKIHIWNTHGHLDHAYGVDFFQKKYNATFSIHKKEIPILDAMTTAASRFGIPEFSDAVVPKIDNFISENKEYTVAGLNFVTILVPGHSPGSICFYLTSEMNPDQGLAEDIIICGDTVFAGSVGRVDLTGGTNMEDLVGNICNKLLTLKGSTILFPGHGPRTTIEIEKESNPFLSGMFNG
jgi:glyoxylase-like metal-dependent hydrolase (beta-lactamase superfamily II)